VCQFDTTANGGGIQLGLREERADARVREWREAPDRFLARVFGSHRDDALSGFGVNAFWGHVNRCRNQNHDWDHDWGRRFEMNEATIDDPSLPYPDKGRASPRV